jgi:catechol 2,3-dioxygenase-like lactoylglutathione lyase family enzyme
MDMKLEVVPIPVRDVDAAKDFYTKQAGFGLDHDVRPSENMRIVQMTPPGSACSVVIGEGLPLGEPGSVKAGQLVVEDLDAVRSRWAPKALPAHATASSRTRTGTCGQSRNTSARKRTFPMVTRAWPMSEQT